MTRIMGQDYTDTDNDDGDQGKKTNGEEDDDEGNHKVMMRATPTRWRNGWG